MDKTAALTALGTHDLCYLADHHFPDGDQGTQGCRISKTATGIWELKTYDTTDICSAICADW